MITSYFDKFILTILTRYENLLIYNAFTNSKCYDIDLLPQEKNNPGLMNGYGGILYYLLKEQGYEVINVLTLESEQGAVAK